MRKGQTIPIEDRFWKHVERSEHHWLWTGCRTASRKGYITYGVTTATVNGKTKYMPAHRVAWQITKGKIPDGLVVRHMCGNPLCVRPDHLAIGTQKENIHDRDRAGTTSRGERHPHAKLTWDKVAQIRASTKPSRMLAREFGVSAATLRAARYGDTWKSNHRPDLERIAIDKLLLA